MVFKKGHKHIKGAFGKGSEHKPDTIKKISISLTGRKYLNRRGKNHWNWQGGRIIDNQGYIQLRKTNHPFAKNGYISEHRLVMEKHLGRYLEKWESIHHRNGIKSDNRLENLEIVFCRPHYGKVICPYCLKNFLIR